jgi:hypothetical protein
MFQDEAGTTPATDGSPVGLWRSVTQNGFSTVQTYENHRPIWSTIASNAKPGLVFDKGLGLNYPYLYAQPTSIGTFASSPSLCMMGVVTFLDEGSSYEQGILLSWYQLPPNDTTITADPNGYRFIVTLSLGYNPPLPSILYNQTGVLQDGNFRSKPNLTSVFGWSPDPNQGQSWISWNGTYSGATQGIGNLFNQSTNILTVGSYFPDKYVGSIHELIFYDNRLPFTDYQRVEGYLAWKWGIQSNLPTYHPYYSNAP